jgi:hypothetical protein
MTNEELDRARGAEAYRLWESAESRVGEENRAMIAARLAREGWTPPPPVDPDVLAFREWAGSFTSTRHLTISDAFLAGARMARAQEQERAKVLVEELDHISKYSRNFAKTAAAALAAYKAGRAAR